MTARLPSLARWLIRRAAPPALEEDLLGDLEEAWRAGASSRLVLWLHILRVVAAVYGTGDETWPNPSQSRAVSPPGARPFKTRASRSV